MDIELVLHTPRARILLIDQTPYGQLIKKRIDKYTYWCYQPWGDDISIDEDLFKVITCYCQFKLFMSERKFFKQILREIHKYLKEERNEFPS